MANRRLCDPKRFHSSRLTELNQRAINCYVLVGLGVAAAIAYSGLYAIAAKN